MYPIDLVLFGINNLRFMQINLFVIVFFVENQFGLTP